ncbi:MAG: hypothetical protein QXU99_07190 [Candidatus Bathyarchaeia archaeon]
MTNLNKAKTLTTLILILAIAIPLFAVAEVNAQSTMKTYPLIDAIPNPVGVNQKTLINFGLINYLNTAADGWNITVTITKPDGSTEILGGGPLKTWSTGMAGYYYVPDQIGTYYIQASFPETVYRNVRYLASESEKLALVVQPDPVPVYPGHALPSEYWTRPIDSQLREWYTIAGSWVATPMNLYAPYNQGPESAHILWTRPIGDTMGGLVGGEFGEHGYGTGDAYEGKWATRFIISGVLYYTKFESGQPGQDIVAVDLRTGKELWTKRFLDNRRPSFAQILYWDCMNYRGAFSYLWFSISTGSGASAVTTWYAVEPLTGEWRFNITNVPSGTNYYGPNGEILKYSISGGRLLRWNSSYVVNRGKTGMQESWGSQVRGVSYDGRNGYDLNVSIRALETPGNVLPGSIQTVFPGDRVIGSQITSTAVYLWALSLQEGSEGTLLFNETWKAPSEWVEGNLTISGFQGGWVAFSKESMVGVIFTKENRVHYGFSLENGKYLWKTISTFYADAWSDTISFTFGPEKVIAYDTLYAGGVGGIVYAFDIKTGALKWTYNASDPYHESYISNNWWIIPLFITDGKIYYGHMEHSALNPMPRGAPFFCLNATTGELIWRADGLFRQSRWGGRAIIGDSVIATQDTYDQRIYAIGKGPSAITVTAPDTAVPFGTPVIIRGTVLDVSPGTEDAAIKLRFPNGVPAVADECMSEWMLYVYKQFEIPSNIKGVTVSLDARDPNGNWVHIGDATTDASGMFSYMYTPEIAGHYTIYATFMGSKSYYGSSAETSLGVMEAPEATPEPTPTPVPISEAYFVPAVVGIIVAIIIVGAVLALLLIKKRA